MSLETCPREKNSGFTLLELVAGIAVGSLLLIFAFQLLSYFSTSALRLRERSDKTHRKTALYTLLDVDLNSVPRSDPDLRGTPDRLARTGVLSEGEKKLRVETRVQYRIVESEGENKLFRSWKWPDLQEEFGNRELLLSAAELEFSYLAPDGRWHSSTRKLSEPIQAVKISTPNDQLIVGCYSHDRKIQNE